MTILVKYSLNIFGFLLLSNGVLFLFSQEAHAYIDPGAGAFVLQFLVAGLLGAAFALKMYWKRLKVFLGGRFFSTEKHNKGDQPE